MAEEIHATQGWVKAAAETVRRIAHRINRSGVPDLMIGILGSTAAIISRNWKLGAMALAPLSEGGMRAMITYGAYQRYRRMHSNAVPA